MTEQTTEETRQARKVAKAYLFLSPFGAALSYGLAAWQGAETRSCLIIAAAAFGLCLFFSLLHYVRGASASTDLAWINAILRLIARR